MTELTSKQRAFAAAYVNNGGNATQAAVAAGYSDATARVQGNQLLRKEHVQAAIRQETFDRLERLAPVALNVLEEVMLDTAAAPRDRVKAAQVLLDRGPLARTMRAEVNVTHRADVSGVIAALDASRRARIEGDPPMLDLEARAVD